MVKANVGLLFPIAVPSLTSGSASSSACPLGASPTMLTLNLGFSKLQTDMKTTSLEEMRIAMETYYEEVCTPRSLML